jgi:hypothetical protein
VSDSRDRFGPDADPAGQIQEAAEAKRCPWCSAPIVADATHCPACGASLAERESLGGMAIPGVTEVDPAVKDAELMARSRARNANVTQPHVFGSIGGVAGGALGFALGSAIDSLVLGRAPDLTPPPRPLDPNATSISMAERLDSSSTDAVWSPYDESQAGEPTNPASDPWADLPQPTTGESAAAELTGAADPTGAAQLTPGSDRTPAPPALEPNELVAPPAPDPWADSSAQRWPDGGAAEPATQDPWADLPPASLEDQIRGTEFDPWAARDDPWASQDAADAARFDPWAPQNQPGGVNDPWATGGGPWSQDPPAEPPGKDAEKPR